MTKKLKFKTENPVIKCLMCYGVDAETQERLKDKEPDPQCGICLGKGWNEVVFKNGLAQNEIRTVRISKETGLGVIAISKQYENQVPRDNGMH